jgi:mannobiose 2-epimerase
MSDVTQLYEEIQDELVNHIMPFWCGLKDHENGGYYGLVDSDLKCNQQAPKGGIATARLLWTFSAVYGFTENDVYLSQAHHAYNLLVDKLIDYKYGGMYWMVDYQGQVCDSRKHIYAQSFAIYGLSEYYKVSGNEEALSLAQELYELIETVGFDDELNIYKEEFTRDLIETDNEMLSENGVIAQGTMNTHLHILEAYTSLLKVWPDSKLKASLINLVDIFYDKIYKKDTDFLKVFFDCDFGEIIDLKSYGHDIEGSWLIQEALDVLESKDSKYQDMVLAIGENIYNIAFDEEGCLYNECEEGHVDRNRVWWVQAEAMIGFMNMYHKTGDMKYMNKVYGLWAFIKKYIVDKREGGEWYPLLDVNNKPLEDPIGEPWKTPYHNGRFCIELLKRIDAIYLTKLQK